LATRDASHVHARAGGGKSTAANLEWESRDLNRQRNYDYKAGRRETPDMTSEEVAAINRANRSTNWKVMHQEALSAGAKAAAVTAVVEGGLSLIEDGVEYKEGKIDGCEYATRVAKKSAIGSVVGGAVGYGGALLVGAVAGTAVAPVVAGVGTMVAVAGVVSTGYRAAKGVKKLVELHQDGNKASSCIDQGLMHTVK